MKYVLKQFLQLPINLLGNLYIDILAYANKIQLVSINKNYTIFEKSTSGNIVLGRYVFISSRTDKINLDKITTKYLFCK